jgi:hypothetical protein
VTAGFLISVPVHLLSAFTHLSSIAVRTDAFYEAFAEEPNNKYLIASAKKGIRSILLDSRIPDDCVDWIVHFHNTFHTGSAPSFMDIMPMTTKALQVKFVVLNM